MAAVVELSDLNGSNGFVINGIDVDDGSGASVSSAGDVNGDGIDDLIIGAFRADPGGGNGAGETYVVFGTTDGFGASLELSDLNGSDGFVLNGIDAQDYSGVSVASAGDVNGDGVDDLIIGAYRADPNGEGSGESYVVFGTTGGFGASFDLSALNGSNGFVINGPSLQDVSGTSVSSAGDVNGDGVDDLIIGTRYAGPNGASYVVFGTTGGFGASLELTALNGSNGFVINGAGSGRSVSSAGDVNGDGLDDLLIGNDRGNGFAGESYVVFGSSSGFAAGLDLSALNGSNGFVISGINENDFSGGSVSSAGDINGDGVDDLIIGATLADPNGISSGESYVVFGSTGGFGASLDLSDLNGSNGFVINGIDARDYSGRSVSSAGDINGDGIDDLIIGAWGADPNAVSSAGESYVVYGSTGGFGASFDLSDLNGTNGFIINGTDIFDRSGGSVSAAGDINGDGVDDLIIGADLADPNGIDTAGTSYVLFGVNTPPVARDDDVVTDEHSVLSGDVRSDNGNGPDSADAVTVTQVDGSAANVGAQITLASGALLTVNANGTFSYDPNGAFSTLAGGATDTDSFTYAITDGSFSPAPDAFAASLELSDLNGTNGFIINGIDAGDRSGQSVSSAGDVNGDGIKDFIIGAHLGDPNGDSSGESYVVYGSTGGFGASFELSALNGSNGFIINGISGGDNSGLPVSSAGDVNGDGIDDLIISAYRATPNGQNGAGENYVVFGSTGGFGASFELSDLNGSNGFVINGVDVLDFSGFSISGAGDVNGDGIDDLIIGALRANPNGSFSGESYVVLGSTGGFAASLDLSDLNGSNGFVLNGVDAYDSSGVSVSAAGDVNGDGIDDLIIGAQNADPNGADSGESYVVFGSTGGFAASFELSSLNGSNGFVINGVDASDLSGFSVSSAGDINGDGIDDLIIGARNANPNVKFEAGESYVVFGSTAGFAASFELSDLNGTNGFVINGIDAGDGSGWSVSASGDVNGDGIDDLIIGARDAAPNGQSYAGESYVIFGRQSFTPVVDVATVTITVTGVGASILDDSLIGTVGADTLDGLAGNDTLDGLAGADSLLGGLGNDSILGQEGADTLRGGDGLDTLISSGGNDRVFGDDGNDQLFTGFGNDRGEGGAGNDLIKTGPGKDTLLGGSGDDTLGASNRSDLLRGDAGNDLLLGSNGNDRLFGGDGDDTMLGGNGRDTLRGDAGADRLVGNGGDDTASYATAASGVDVKLWEAQGSQGSLGEAIGDVLIDIERLEGSGFNDTLEGAGGNNRLFGLNGDDQLDGMGGNDILLGGRGADTLSGGSGNDQFWYFNDDGADTITDFTAGAGTDDVIRLFGLGSAFNSFAEVIAASSDNGSDTTIDFGGGNSILLQGVTVGDLHQDDFVF